jgi:hypothetical protein
MISSNLSDQAQTTLTFKSFGAESKICPDLKADDLFIAMWCSKSVCEQNFTGNNFPIENVLYTVPWQDRQEDKEL